MTIHEPKKAQGVVLGRPRKLPKSIATRISKERGRGKTLAAIAEGLNKGGIPTAQGGRQWWPSTVRAVLRSR